MSRSRVDGASCVKWGYNSKGEALAALGGTRARRGGKKRKEKGVYKCRYCHLWHMTSKDKDY